MAYVHGSVNAMSKQYLANEKRYNYTTPKSFLELVSNTVIILNYLLIAKVHVCTYIATVD